MQDVRSGSLRIYNGETIRHVTGDTLISQVDTLAVIDAEKVSSPIRLLLPPVSVGLGKRLTVVRVDTNDAAITTLVANPGDLLFSAEDPGGVPEYRMKPGETWMGWPIDWINQTRWWCVSGMGGGGGGTVPSTGCCPPAWTWAGSAIADPSIITSGMMGLVFGGEGSGPFLVMSTIDADGVDQSAALACYVAGDQVWLKATPVPGQSYFARYQLSNAFQPLDVNQVYSAVTLIAQGGTLTDFAVGQRVTADVELTRPPSAGVGVGPSVTVTVYEAPAPPIAIHTGTPYASPRQLGAGFVPGASAVLVTIDLDYPAGFNDPGNVYFTLKGLQTIGNPAIPPTDFPAAIWPNFQPPGMPLAAAARLHAVVPIYGIPALDQTLSVSSNFEIGYESGSFAPGADTGIKLVGWSLVVLQNQ